MSLDTCTFDGGYPCLIASAKASEELLNMPLSVHDTKHEYHNLANLAGTLPIVYLFADIKRTKFEFGLITYFCTRLVKLSFTLAVFGSNI